jgi:cysteine desulfurase
VSRSVELRPIFAGGGQERGLRSGTENVPAIVGFASALISAQELREAESERLSELQATLVTNLETHGGVINGGAKNRLANNINIRFAGIDNERLVFQLDELGFMVSSGSACHARNGVASRTLQAIGLSTAEANSSIRISMGRRTTKEDVENLIRSISQLVAKNR